MSIISNLGAHYTHYNCIIKLCGTIIIIKQTDFRTRPRKPNIFKIWETSMNKSIFWTLLNTKNIRLRIWTPNDSIPGLTSCPYSNHQSLTFAQFCGQLHHNINRLLQTNFYSNFGHELISSTYFWAILGYYGPVRIWTSGQPTYHEATDINKPSLISLFFTS